MLNKSHHIAIICSDREKALDFYGNKLGFEVIRLVERPQQNDILVMMKSGDVVLELFIKPDAPQRVNNPEAMGLRHLAFYVENMDEAVAWLNGRATNLLQASSCNSDDKREGRRPLLPSVLSKRTEISLSRTF